MPNKSINIDWPYAAQLSLCSSRPASYAWRWRSIIMDENIYKSFNEILKNRLQDNVFTTEDSVRYSFFAALLRGPSFDPNDIIMEYPHNRINKAQVDTYIPNYDGKEVIIEFKYDRAIPSGKNAPRPQKAGKHFNDMSRLLDFSTSLPAIRLFVYLTDSEMASYLRNPSNNLVDYFDMIPKSRLEIDEGFFRNKSKTFQSSSSGGVLKAIIHCDWTSQLPQGHELRIYNITQ